MVHSSGVAVRVIICIFGWSLDLNWVLLFYWFSFSPDDLNLQKFSWPTCEMAQVTSKSHSWRNPQIYPIKWGLSYTAAHWYRPKSSPWETYPPRAFHTLINGQVLAVWSRSYLDLTVAINHQPSQSFIFPSLGFWWSRWSSRFCHGSPWCLGIAL